MDHYLGYKLQKHPELFATPLEWTDVTIYYKPYLKFAAYGYYFAVSFEQR
jgi:hypothetical protein